MSRLRMSYSLLAFSILYGLALPWVLFVVAALWPVIKHLAMPLR